MASRNQREGKYIAGWCYNPPYDQRVFRMTGKLVQKTRAGRHFDLVRVRNFNDGGVIIPGATYVRYYRQGAFE